MSRAGILTFLISAVLVPWSRTIRVGFVNKETPERLAAEGKSCIYAFWHGRQFLLLQSHRRTGIVIAVSESRDGDIQAGILKRFGFPMVRGSSRRKGERALLGLIVALRKGKSVALAVDGPRGPVCEVKQGVIYLAGKLRAPIIPVATSARRYWVLPKVWDRLLLPCPFTEGVVMYGDPITVVGTSHDALESKRRELEEALNGLTARADGHFNTHR